MAVDLEAASGIARAPGILWKLMPLGVHGWLLGLRRPHDAAAALASSSAGRRPGLALPPVSLFTKKLHAQKWPQQLWVWEFRNCLFQFCRSPRFTAALHPSPLREVPVSAAVQAPSWVIVSLLLRCGLGGWEVMPLRRVRFMVVQAPTLWPRLHACFLVSLPPELHGSQSGKSGSLQMAVCSVLLPDLKNGALCCVCRMKHNS